MSEVNEINLWHRIKDTYFKLNTVTCVTELDESGHQFSVMINGSLISFKCTTQANAERVRAELLKALGVEG